MEKIALRGGFKDENVSHSLSQIEKSNWKNI